jgi:outer membrane protein OmpA-like peptidoglycan-associated protein
MRIRSIVSLALLVFSLIQAYPTSGFGQSDTAKHKVLQTNAADVHTDNIRELNSSENDATPIITADESTIYFTSYRDGGKPAVFVSHRTSKTAWGAPTKFAELPGKESISSFTMTGDGQHAFFGCCNRSDGILGSCDIYEADILDGKLGNISTLGKTINTEWWDAQPCVSQDGQLLFFSSDRKHGQGGSDIYMSAKNPSGGWSEPVDLSFNTSGNEMSPMISSDNQTLYFAADNLPGGFGGYDIYVTHRTGQNSWSVPQNLGPAVNSKQDEMFFAIPPGEDAIYLASDRDGGLGKFDIYRITPNIVAPPPAIITLKGSVLDAETGQRVKTQPEIEITLSATSEAMTNGGSGADYTAVVPLGKLVKIRAGAEGYVSGSIEAQTPSTRDPNGFVQDIKLTPSRARIDGHVTNVFSHKPLQTRVKLEEMEEGSPIPKNTYTAQTDANGAFSFNINPLTTYRISTTVESYDPYSTTFAVPASRETMLKVDKEIRLQPAAIDAVLVNFDFNKSDVKKDEFSKLERFIQQVKENSYVRIEVNGHTDDVGTQEYNEKLSERRAVTVEDYLLSRGVPRDQLAVVKGFGKANPIDTANTDAARAKNRRVEVRIVGKQ